MSGAVQGVGFRPFVYRLAKDMGLTGWVLNSSGGLSVEVEGEPALLECFLRRVEAEKPPAAVVLMREVSVLEPVGYQRFEIRTSDQAEEKTVSLLPDLATCSRCLAEMRDARNRRHGYPFTNCTNCGPRYTIILDIPYDRPRTTMRHFQLCPECLREYSDPDDRRFHAQPNACPICGPSLHTEPRTSAGGNPIADAVSVLRSGLTVALKGIGGFQLLVDARNEDAVVNLRSQKRREEKPFALLMDSLETVRQYCDVSTQEEALLSSPAAPIVLLRPKTSTDIAPSVARSSPYLGVMLPCSPLHHLLMSECGFPVVATSGNVSDEPIAIDNDEAMERLGGIADLFVMHNRPIARPCDDSVVRLARGRESVLRRARGYAPLPVRVPEKLPPVLAVGGHLKNTVAVAIGQNVFVSQHIGDLDTVESRRAFGRAIDDLCRLYQFEPHLIACDLHPDYASTAWAQASGLPVVPVQHHQAHVAACAAENDIRGDYLGVAWDGTGYGLDGTIWGGEFFLVRGGGFNRVSHLRPFRLPGGEAAVREGWRSAESLLAETFGPEAVDNPVIRQMLQRGLNAPVTTSVGRLFDAVASISGVAHENRFEGQAAMLLERKIGSMATQDCYPLAEMDGMADWRPLIEAIRADVAQGRPDELIAARFHNALVAWIVAVAERIGVRDVVLSGGVFQNAYLVERSVQALESSGFRAITHQRIPANDGGIALGQAVLAGRAAG